MQRLKYETIVLRSMSGDQNENPNCEPLSTDSESSDDQLESRVQQEPPKIPIKYIHLTKMSPQVLDKSANSNLMLSPHENSIVDWHHEKPSVVRLNYTEQDSQLEFSANQVERATAQVEGSAQKSKRGNQHGNLIFEELEESKHQSSIESVPGSAEKQPKKIFSLSNLLSREFDYTGKRARKSLFSKEKQPEPFYQVKNKKFPLQQQQLQRVNPPIAPTQSKEPLQIPNTGKNNQRRVDKNQENSAGLQQYSSLYQVQQAAISRGIQMRNKPQTLMKAISGAKARYASYDNQHAVKLSEPKNYTIEEVDCLRSQDSEQQNKIEEMKELPIPLRMLATLDDPSQMTFREVLSNRMTATFQESSQQPMSSSKPENYEVKTFEDQAESKIHHDQFADFVSDGESEDSNHEAMVSMSSNHKLTPGRDREFGISSREKLSGKRSFEMVFYDNQNSPENALASSSFFEMDSGTPRGLVEFRRDLALKELKNKFRVQDFEVQLVQPETKKSPCTLKEQGKSMRSNSGLRASETPPMPSSSKAETVSYSDDEDEQRKLCLQNLYSSGQDFLEQQINSSKYESDQKFIEEEREKLDMVLSQHRKKLGLIRRMVSNGTIKEESEGAMTEIPTPRKSAIKSAVSSRKSPFDVTQKQISPKIQEINGQVSSECEADITDQEIDVEQVEADRDAIESYSSLSNQLLSDSLDRVSEAKEFSSYGTEQEQEEDKVVDIDDYQHLQNKFSFSTHQLKSARDKTPIRGEKARKSTDCSHKTPKTLIEEFTKAQQTQEIKISSNSFAQESSGWATSNRSEKLSNLQQNFSKQQENIQQHFSRQKLNSNSEVDSILKEGNSTSRTNGSANALSELKNLRAIMDSQIRVKSPSRQETRPYQFSRSAAPLAVSSNEKISQQISKGNEFLTVIPEKVVKKTMTPSSSTSIDFNPKSSMRGEDQQLVYYRKSNTNKVHYDSKQSSIKKIVKCPLLNKSQSEKAITQVDDGPTDSLVFIMSQLNMLEGLLHETFTCKQALKETSQELSNQNLTFQEQKVARENTKTKQLRQFIQQQAEIEEAKGDIKNVNLQQREKVKKQTINVDKKGKVEDLRSQVLASLHKVQQICSDESMYIGGALQGPKKKDEHEKTISTCRARAKSKPSQGCRTPVRYTQVPMTVFNQLKPMIKKNQSTCSLMDYNLPSASRSQDRIRETTISYRYKKQFRTLAREASAQTLMATKPSLLNCKQMKTIKEKSTRVSTANASYNLEQIIGQNLKNGKINTRSLIAQHLRHSNVTNMSPNTSMMSLTQYYISRSQYGAPKHKKTYAYKN